MNADISAAIRHRGNLRPDLDSPKKGNKKVRVGQHIRLHLVRASITGKTIIGTNMMVFVQRLAQHGQEVKRTCNIADKMDKDKMAHRQSGPGQLTSHQKMSFLMKFAVSK